ncbi:MAG: nucleotidyltransferase domain-containing protein [Legionella sp.]|jgi:predicted nucleotidyltransferase|nr:nucleotidyltransferase domain-containing protein [Legionella sp.]
MRLSTEEIQILKQAVAKQDTVAEIYLYGSRVDMSKKGGDIDLLIISKKITRTDLTSIRWAFFDKFGEQKMDFIIDQGDLKDPFVAKIYKQAIKL